MAMNRCRNGIKVAVTVGWRKFEGVHVVRRSKGIDRGNKCNMHREIDNI